MLTVSTSHVSQPDTHFAVQDGLALTVHDRSDIGLMLASVLSAFQKFVLGGTPGPVHQAQHIDAIWRRIYAELLAIDTFTETVDTQDLDGKETWIPMLKHAAEEPSTHHDIKSLISLVLALRLLRDLWEDPDSSPLAMEATLAIADPRLQNASVSIRFDQERALLVLKPGSLSATLGSYLTLTSARWFITVGLKVPGLAITPDAAAARLVERARERAQNAYPSPNHLPRLDQLSDEEQIELASQQLIVIYLHGLFSTDLGTFDGLTNYVIRTGPLDVVTNLDQQWPEHAQLLRKHIDNDDPTLSQIQASGLTTMPSELIRKNVAFVGWPHNTMTSVKANAGELRSRIIRLLGQPDEMGPKICFVCHSRGGLVARATIANLLAGDSKWVDRIAFCATFGSPHEGAGLAEHNAKEIATYLLALKSTDRFTSLVDVLAYASQRTLAGLEDLKPTGATTGERQTSYLYDLFDLENKLKTSNAHRYPKFIVIGGELDQSLKEKWLQKPVGIILSHYLGTVHHDLVVTLKSSLSEQLDPEITIPVICDHFGYFPITTPSSRSDDDFNFMFSKSEDSIAFPWIASEIWRAIDMTKARRQLEPGGAAVTRIGAYTQIGSIRIRNR